MPPAICCSHPLSRWHTKLKYAPGYEMHHHMQHVSLSEEPESGWHAGLSLHYMNSENLKCVSGVLRRAGCNFLETLRFCFDSSKCFEIKQTLQLQWLIIVQWINYMQLSQTCLIQPWPFEFFYELFHGHNTVFHCNHLRLMGIEFDNGCWTDCFPNNYGSRLNMWSHAITFGAFLLSGQIFNYWHYNKL